MSAVETPLAMAERHVVEGQERIARQTATITRLTDAGPDTTLAASILHELEHTLELSCSHRDRLLGEQAKLGSTDL